MKYSHVISADTKKTECMIFMSQIISIFRIISSEPLCQCKEDRDIYLGANIDRVVLRANRLPPFVCDNNIIRYVAFELETLSATSPPCYVNEITTEYYTDKKSTGNTKTLASSAILV